MREPSSLRKNKNVTLTSRIFLDFIYYFRLLSLLYEKFTVSETPPEGNFSSATTFTEFFFQPSQGHFDR